MRIEAGTYEGSRAKVFLDGFEQKYCVMADSTLNYVRRYKRLNGQFVKDGKGDLVVETVFGSVVIYLPEETPC